MKLPQHAPDTDTLLARQGADSLARLLPHITPLPAGKYLHWDDLRHRKPPDGLQAEDWWTAVLLGRAPLLHELPLADKHGRPLRLATPTPVIVDLHHIDRDAAGNIRTPEGAPIRESRDGYLLGSLIEEAITSSQLEGASTTRQAAAAMLREGRAPRDTGERMIFNNFRAMTWLRGLRETPITPERILELHRTITEDTLDHPADAGRLRSSDDVQVVDSRDGEVLHQPPPHASLPARLEALCAFANQDETATPFVHPVLRAILLHFMIGYDHPFVDGNGRTARALFYWAMARSGYWLMEFVSISHILRRAPTRYVRAYLHSETDGGDTTYFVLHQLGVIREAIAALHVWLARKSAERRNTEQLLATSPALRTRFNPRQVALLTHALQHPGDSYRVDVHQREHGVVYQTARTDLLALEAAGLLDRGKQGRAYVFFAPTDLRERLARLA